MMKNKLVDAVGIDGPAGSGKSTIAKEVALRLGFTYIDTGAMYRAVALQAQRLGVDLKNEEQMVKVASESIIEFDESGTKILLAGENVSDQIRTPEITGITKYAARVSGVREILVEAQRAMSRQRCVVMEGRDITTVVLPAARWRIFLTASPEVRAERRFADFKMRGHEVDFQQLLSEIIVRDESDNEVGPMKEAQELAAAGKGIMLLDTSLLNEEEVIAKIVEYVESN